MHATGSWTARPTAPPQESPTTGRTRRPWSGCFADPNCFSVQEIAPGGYTPWYSGVITDLSAVAGLRRIAANGLTRDASASYGAH